MCRPCEEGLCLSVSRGLNVDVYDVSTLMKSVILYSGIQECDLNMRKLIFQCTRQNIGVVPCFVLCVKLCIKGKCDKIILLYSVLQQLFKFSVSLNFNRDVPILCASIIFFKSLQMPIDVKCRLYG